MRTSGTHIALEASGAVARGEATTPPAVPTQLSGPDAPATLTPTTSLQPAARMPSARMGLGTQALATALVVRSCPPGHLRMALDALEEPRRR